MLLLGIFLKAKDFNEIDGVWEISGGLKQEVVDSPMAKNKITHKGFIGFLLTLSIKLNNK